MVNEDREREILRRRLLGQGLACEPLSRFDLGCDLRLSKGPNGSDLARVSGIDNLTQALRIALTTLLGSDIFNIDFGFDGLAALADETDSILQRERIRIGIIRVLRKDGRVRRIIDVKLGDGRLEAPAPGSRELDIRIQFETISGDQSSTQLGG